MRYDSYHIPIKRERALSITTCINATKKLEVKMLFKNDLQ